VHCQKTPSLRLRARNFQLSRTLIRRIDKCHIQVQAGVKVTREVFDYIGHRRYYLVSVQLSNVTKSGPARESKGTPKMFAALVL